jgi:hypothetical protein
MDNVISGKDFNKLGIIPCKILKRNLNHYNYQYKLGLNILKEKFKPYGECEGGGLYFCDMKKFYLYNDYGPFVGILKLPNDAKIYVEEDKFKTDKFIIEKIVDKKEFYLDDYYDTENSFKIFEKLLFHIENPYYYLRKQTDEINWLCIRMYPKFLERIENPNIEIIKYCINRIPGLFYHLENKPYDLCLFACSLDYHCLNYVPSSLINNQLCETACRLDGNALEFVPSYFKTYELCKIACKSGNYALKFVPENFKNYNLCKIACLSNGFTIKYINKNFDLKQKYKLLKIAFNNDSSSLDFIDVILNHKEIEYILKFADELEVFKSYNDFLRYVYRNPIFKELIKKNITISYDKYYNMLKI